MVQSEIDIEAVNGEPAAKSLPDGRICFLTYSVILSLVFIGVATNFYWTLLDIETSTKCILTSTSPNRDLNFCEHLRTWKLCGFYGIFLPGCIVLIFGSVSLFAGLLQDSQANSQDWYQMFDCLFSMTKFINIIVLILLWTSDVATTHITGTYGLGMAAKIYMVFLGLELGIVVVVLFIAYLYILCSF